MTTTRPARLLWGHLRSSTHAASPSLGTCIELVREFPRAERRLAAAYAVEHWAKRTRLQFSDAVCILSLLELEWHSALDASWHNLASPPSGWSTHPSSVVAAHRVLARRDVTGWVHHATRDVVTQLVSAEPDPKQRAAAQEHVAYVLGDIDLAIAHIEQGVRMKHAEWVLTELGDAPYLRNIHESPQSQALRRVLWWFRGWLGKTVPACAGRRLVDALWGYTREAHDPSFIPMRAAMEVGLARAVLTRDSGAELAHGLSLG